MNTIATKNIRICKTCGKEYYRRGTRKFATCSTECRKLYISKLQTGKKRGPNKRSQGKIIHKDRIGHYKPCLVCKKDIYIYPKGYDRKKFCSMECRNKGMVHKSGKDSHSWKGGKCKSGEYIYVKTHGHPMANKQNYVLEHRLVMEKYLGRYLEKNEEVHHINQNKSDNRIENLQLVLQKAHYGIIKCPHCLKEFKIK